MNVQQLLDAIQAALKAGTLSPSDIVQTFTDGDYVQAKSAVVCEAIPVDGTALHIHF